MSLVERINNKCKEKGTNIKALERELGFGNGNIRRWDVQKPSYDKMMAVAEKLQVSFNWLITGKESSELTEDENRLIELYRQADDRGKKVIMMNAELVNPSQEQQSSTSKLG